MFSAGCDNRRGPLPTLVELLEYLNHTTSTCIKYYYDANANNNNNNMPRIISNRLLSGQPLARAADRGRRYI